MVEIVEFFKNVLWFVSRVFEPIRTAHILIVAVLLTPYVIAFNITPIKVGVMMGMSGYCIGAVFLVVYGMFIWKGD